MSHGRGKSDCCVVPGKLLNKAVGETPAAAEAVERRRQAKGNAVAARMSRRLGREHDMGMAHARQRQKPYRVGVLLNGAAVVDGKPHPVLEELRNGLTQLGYVEGKNVVYEARFAEDQLDRLPGFAVELVAKEVDVFATYGAPLPTRHERPPRRFRSQPLSLPIRWRLGSQQRWKGPVATSPG